MATKPPDHIPPPKIKDIYDFSNEALSQLKTWFEQQGIQIPVSQLVGNATVPATPTAQDIVDALVALNIISQL